VIRRNNLTGEVAQFADCLLVVCRLVKHCAISFQKIGLSVGTHLSVTRDHHSLTRCAAVVLSQLVRELRVRFRGPAIDLWSQQRDVIWNDHHLNQGADILC
jgi:hypothetical protein